MEFADTDQMAFLYQDRISVLLGTLNDLDYKLDRARYVLTNADGKGCGPTDTGRLDFSHVSARQHPQNLFLHRASRPCPPAMWCRKRLPEEPGGRRRQHGQTETGCRKGGCCGRPGRQLRNRPLTDPARMTANETKEPHVTKMF